LGTSISLDPNFGDSYALLAFAQSSSGNSEKALASMLKAIAIDPRNENYRFNLANIYLANRQPDQALAVLESLQNSGNPELASRVGAALANLRQFQQMTEPGACGMLLVRREGAEDTTNPSHVSGETPSGPVKTAAKWGTPIFLRGTLSSVDCSTEPIAVLTLVSGTKTLKLKVSNRTRLILIGADRFSCSWARQKIAVNYREAEGETDVMSLEIQ
jgi:hypothetical protein